MALSGVGSELISLDPGGDMWMALYLGSERVVGCRSWALGCASPLEPQHSHP